MKFGTPEYIKALCDPERLKRNYLIFDTMINIWMSVPLVIISGAALEKIKNHEPKTKDII